MGYVLAAAAAQGVGFSGPRAAGGELPRRKLGRTGASVSILGLGGAHIGLQRDPAESVRIIRAAIDAGITFLDNSWDYNDGQSELRMAQFEAYKSSHTFDSTHRHPEWLG